MLGQQQVSSVVSTSCTQHLTCEAGSEHGMTHETSTYERAPDYLDSRTPTSPQWLDLSPCFRSLVTEIVHLVAALDSRKDLLRILE
jgi:hypothetical protein